MDRLDHLQAARALQRPGEGPLEGLLLLGGGHGGLRAEDGVQELLVNLVRLPGVEEGVVDVRRPIVEGGEEEAQLRGGNHLPGGAAVELVFPGEIAQLHFAGFHRADAA